MKIDDRALFGFAGAFALVFVLGATAQAAPTLYDNEVFTSYARVMTPAFPPSPAPGETCPCPPVMIPAGGTPAVGTFPFNVIGSSPAGLTVPAGVIGLTASGTNTNPITPYVFSSTVFSVLNQSGTLTAGGGPGSGTFAPRAGVPPVPASRLRVGFVAGTNQFGGTVSLLGNFYNYFSWVSTIYGPGLFKGYANFPLMAGRTFAGTVMATGMASHTTLTSMGQPFVTTTLYTAWGFPWTTGTVTGIAFTGTAPTSTSAMGFDGRNAAGTTGTLQLVTPWIDYFRGSYDGGVAGTSVWVVTMETPEPGHVILLGTGLATLGFLYRMRTRKR
jgi:hypothetical protein